MADCQEAIAAALAEAAGFDWHSDAEYADIYRARYHADAAVAMDAARAAVEALDTYGLADLGRSFGHGWNACHAQICHLLTPEGERND